MDIELLFRWLSIVSLAISCVSAVAVYMNSPGRKLQAMFDKLGQIQEAQEDTCRGSLKEHDRRIQKVEDGLMHVPTSIEFGALQVSVTRVEGDMKRMEDQVGGVRRVVDRIDDYLRTNR